MIPKDEVYLLEEIYSFITFKIIAFGFRKRKFAFHPLQVATVNVAVCTINQPVPSHSLFPVRYGRVRVSELYITVVIQILYHTFMSI